MKHFSKLLAAVLVFTAVALPLTSCNKKDDTSSSSSSAVISETISSEAVAASSQAESSSSTATSSSTTTIGQAPKVAGTYDVSGQSKNLNGRTIKMQMGIIQTQTDDATTSDGLKLIALRKSVEKKLNCKLQSVNVDYATMQASILAGDPACDIWNLETVPKFLQAYQSKLIQPIEPLKSMNLADTKRYSNYTELTLINGQHWGFSPQTYGIWRIAISNMMYVNKKILASKGISIDSIYEMQNNGTWTWSKFAEIAKKVSDPANGIYAITDADSNFYNDLMASNGVDWIKKTGETFSFNAGDTKSQEVMTYYQKLVSDKSLSVNYDSSIGGINTDNSLLNMTNDFDLLNFNAGKAAFLDSFAYLPYFGKFGSNINNIAVVFCPKPDGASDYKSYTNHACIVSIPVYGDEDSETAKRKAVETATVIQYLFAPYKSQTEYNNQLRDDVSAFASDATFQKNFLAIDKKQFFSYSGIAGKVWRGDSNAPGWLDYVPKIANGTDYSGVVNAEKDRYNNYLKDLSKQK